VPRDAAIVAGDVDYGAPFAAAVAADNVFAVQFHPEKSQGAGRRLLDAFAAWLAS
jgi:glutamine amidotransferase